MSMPSPVRHLRSVSRIKAGVAEIAGYYNDSLCGRDFLPMVIQENRKDLSFTDRGGMGICGTWRHGNALFLYGQSKRFSDQGFWRKFFDAKTDSIGSYVIYSKNSKNKTQEPDLVKANPFGLKNMLGNVMEYCADKYDPEAYAKSGSSATDPLVTEGTEWVVRGGNYTSDAADLRCASRDYTKHEAWLKTDPQQPKSIWWYSDIRGIGFRVVCEPNK